jgi:maltoporin
VAVAFALPELYAEANHILGSQWSAWIGAKFFRSNDIHIADHFYLTTTAHKALA